LKKLFKNLTFWVLSAIVLGILLGHFEPRWALFQVMEKPFSVHFLGQELKVGNQQVGWEHPDGDGSVPSEGGCALGALELLFACAHALMFVFFAWVTGWWALRRVLALGRLADRLLSVLALLVRSF
jgi:hypothetical protein